MVGYTLTVDLTLPTWVGAGVRVVGSGDISVPAPAGILPGDLLILAVESDTFAAAAPSGWTIHPDLTGSTNQAALAVFYRIASGTETSVTVADTGDHQQAVMSAIRNAHIPTPLGNGLEEEGSGPISFPSIATTKNNSMLVAVLAHSRPESFTAGGWADAGVTGETERFDYNTTLGNDGALALWTGVRETAGASGAFTVTPISTNPRWIGLHFVVEPRDAGHYTAVLTPVNLNRGPIMSAVAGAYALVGAAVTFRVKLSMDAAAGSYAVSGTAATLSTARTLVAEAGSYVLTGTDAMLSTLKGILANAGAYALTGTAAVLTVGRTLIAAAGSYLFTGTDAELEADVRTFPAGRAPKARTITVAGQRERRVIA